MFHRVQQRYVFRLRYGPSSGVQIHKEDIRLYASESEFCELTNSRKNFMLLINLVYAIKIHYKIFKNILFTCPR